MSSQSSLEMVGHDVPMRNYGRPKGCVVFALHQASQVFLCTFKRVKQENVSARRGQEDMYEREVQEMLIGEFLSQSRC